MPPRSLFFLPAALVLFPACEAEPPPSAPPSQSPEMCAPALEPAEEALPQARAVAAAPCGETGDPCCEGDSCAEGHECSSGVCVVPFLEPRNADTAEE